MPAMATDTSGLVANCCAKDMGGDSDTTLPNAARASAKVLAQALEGLDKAIDDLEDEITNANAQNEMTRLLYKVPGIGKIIASVIAASVPDPSVFKSGRDFTAWLGEAKLKASRRSGPSPSRGTDTSGNCSCWGRPRC